MQRQVARVAVQRRQAVITAVRPQRDAVGQRDLCAAEVGGCADGQVVGVECGFDAECAAGKLLRKQGRRRRCAQDGGQD